MKKPLLIILTILTFAIPVANQAQGNVRCGSIVEAEFSPEGRRHSYSLDLAPGDSFNIIIDPFGDTLAINLEVRDPTGHVFMNQYGGRDGESYELASPVISGRGTYTIEPYGRSSSDIGIYTLYIGCTLRDGTVISPGDAAPDVQPTEQVATPTELPVNFVGFPGLTPIDFSNGIELPLQVGQAQPVPVGADVILYTYEANVDEVRSFSLTRMSGNISIGVTVINRDTNEILFFGGMPSSDNLRVDLKFPSGGTYLIGLFRVETAEHSGTSGAVQILLE